MSGYDRTLEEICQKIGKARIRSHTTAENLFFKVLYDRARQFTGAKESFEDISKAVSQGKADFEAYRQACITVQNWYRGRYQKGGHKGIDRKVVIKKGSDGKNALESYKFDMPVNGDIFYSYFLSSSSGGQKNLRTGDGFDLILHCAVAFWLTPAETDKLLGFYGFQGLHMRNVHHLAIYSVLSGAVGLPTEDLERRNPFAEVRDIYMLLLDKLHEKGTIDDGTETERAAFNKNSTRVVRNYVTSLGTLSGDYASELVARYSWFYNVQHKRLTEEYRHLIGVLVRLYAERPTPEADRKYSFRNLLQNYAKPFSGKSIYNLLTKTAIQPQHHPTREMMILMWMYSFCFYFRPQVDASERVVDENNAKSYYNSKDKKLNVRDYFFGTTPEHTPIKTWFSGKEFLDFINNKLSSFSWNRLDKRNEFDRIIMFFGDLNYAIESDAVSDMSQYVHGDGKKDLVDFRALNDRLNADVPVPLAVIFFCLEEIKKAENELLRKRVVQRRRLVGEDVRRGGFRERKGSENAGQAVTKEERPKELIKVELDYLPLECDFFEYL